MKIALIAAPFPLEEMPSPPLGLSYVAAAFREAGAEVILLDYIVEKYTPEKMRSALEAFQPDAVGITSVTMNFKQAARIIQDVKEYNPAIVTMFGGPHVTFDAENTLRAYPEVDIVALGEAELTIRDLTPVLCQREKWVDVKGIAFLHEGRLVNNGRREFFKELDTLALPARDLLPIARYRALGFPVSIITSRGCPYRCIFCQGTRMVGHKIRYRDPIKIVDEIENILALGFKRINISDDFFTSSRKQVGLLCDEIKRRKLKFAWSAFARVNSISHELLETMMETGCDSISFGIESGNQEMLDRVDKHIKLDQARKAIQVCKEVGMHVFSSFMVGLPGETKQTLQETDAFARELGADFAYHFLAPLPGTPVRDQVEEYDIKILSNDWNEYDANRAIVSTSSLTTQEMEEFVAEYDACCKELWWQIEQAYSNGTASPHEIYRWETKHRMDFVYQLFTEDIIENKAQGLLLRHDQPPMETLIEVLNSHTSVEEAVVRKAVEAFVEQGNLDWYEQEGKVTWVWPDAPVTSNEPRVTPLPAPSRDSLQSLHV